MNSYIWFMIIATVIGLILFAILHEEEGVVQRVKIYGNVYTIKTFIYIDGKPFESWIDSTTEEKEFEEIKKNRTEQAQDFYNTLMFKNGK